jgi:hypothetical protein
MIPMINNNFVRVVFRRSGIEVIVITAVKE